MRTKKALINSSTNILCFIIAFIPSLVIRKIFLDTLGNDILGLNSLFTNIIGWLSIVELGVGTAIVYSLYKPFADNDRSQIRAYIRFYGKFYRSIGFVILIIGLIITPFLKYFIKGDIDLTLVSVSFILFLINSFISYMFLHRLCILNVAQEEYKVTIGTTISKLIITLIQYLMLKVYPNFLIFIVVQIVVNLVYFIIINMYITKKYPWLNEKKENLDEKTSKSLLKNVRAMFMHKIGDLVVNSTDNIVISKFVGLGALANYANYQMVIVAFQTVVSRGLIGLTASIGNMLSTEDKKKAYNVHKKVFFLNFWAVSFIVISLYNTLNQFIGMVFGEKYLLDALTFAIILMNVYFASMRGSVEQFQSGSGNFYQDRYAPIVESIINIVASIVLVRYIGIAGVFIGTLISNFTVVFWTKPYVVYKYVFNKKLIDYFKMYFKYLVIALIPLIITGFATEPFKNDYSIISFIINCIINVIIINLFYLVVFFKSEEFKYYLSIFKRR